MSETTNDVILEAKNLTKVYPIRGSALLPKNRKAVHAVDGVSFQLRRGKTLGLVGESGCGKSTTGRLLVGIETPTGGEVLYEGEDLLKMKKEAFKKARLNLQMIFQDPYASLNPRKRVVDILTAPILYHGLETKDTVDKRVEELLEMVGLPKSAKARYPHEFSGGQRQRITIARALALKPEVIVCDEPVSALDASIQAQILNLLRSLQKELGVTYLFIAHGLGAVHYISDEIAVMYLGRIVETGEGQEVFQCRPWIPKSGGRSRCRTARCPLPSTFQRAAALQSAAPMRHRSAGAGSRSSYRSPAGRRGTLPPAGIPLGGRTPERRPEMGKYIAKRLLIALAVLFGITIVDYAIMSLAGNPLQIIGAGPKVNQAAVAQKAENWGLNDPVVVQYFRWLSETLHGNLGTSYKSYEPVSSMIASHLGPTLILMTSALILALVIAVFAGIYSAVHQHSKADYVIVTLAFLGQSIPQFFLGLVLIFPSLLRHAASGKRGKRGAVSVSDPSLHRACRGDGRKRCPVHPLEYAGDPEQGLSENSTGKGNRQEACDLQARPAQCPDPDHHGDRHGDSESLWRLHRRGAGLLLAGTGSHDHECGPAAGLSRDHGDVPSDCGGGSCHQPCD